MNILDAIYSKRLYLDGAMGTELIKRGLDTKNAERLNITNKDDILSVMRSYLNAGSDIIYTNSFGANSLKHKGENLEELILSSINVAKEAIKGYENKYVGYSIGPLPDMLEPYGKITFDDAYNEFKYQADIVNKNPTDFVVFETFTDIWMLKAGILAFRENSNLPIFVSMSINDNGRTFSGTSIECYAEIAESLGAKVLGINCGFGPDKMLPLAKRLLKCSHLPIYIKPNAGLPKFSNGQMSYDINAEDFSNYMVEIANLGVSILGGCCGTNAEYIEKTIEKTKSIPFSISNNHFNRVTSQSEYVDIKDYTMIGERINPTGKPRLKSALLEHNLDYVLSIATAEIEKGAKVLDVNVGMPGVDETTLLPEVVKMLSSAVTTPLMIDTSNVVALERALRIVSGVPIINSVNGSDEILHKILPLAKKYGAMVVALCLDDNGIPETTDGRLKIADHILDVAKEYNIPSSRFLFDALTMSVSVNSQNAIITLNTVKELKKRGLNTILGVSNVSFGLPAREIINGTMLKLAKECGLSSAIINPALSETNDEYAYNLLMGRDENAEKFIEKYSGFTATKVEDPTLTLKSAIIKGLKSDGLSIAKTIATKDNYMSVINDEVIGALNEVGKNYEEGRAFLPNLIISAESAGVILDYIKSTFIKSGDDSGDVMLLATVKGDIHDIGKNIVKAVLSNYGYKIFDLGKDVSTKTILENISSKHPRFIGLSALMTTSLDSMRESVKAIKEADQNIIVIVGGAVVTEEFKNEIGAGIYAKDAQDAVRKLKEYK